MTIHYFDVSHYQGAYVPIGPTCAKATEGTTYIDPQYGGIRKRTLAGGWPFLPYHFLTHGNINAQVDHAFGVIGHQSLMLDVESEPNKPDPTLTDVLAFADRWHTITGERVTLAYIPRWFWSAHWGSPSLAGLTSRGIGLVSSNYTTYSDNGPGWAVYGGATPIIWQYTSTPFDTNAFKGTTAELADLWANGTDTSTNPSAPVAPPEEDMLATDLLKIDPQLFGGATTAQVGTLIVDAAQYGLVARNNTAALVKQLDALTAAVTALAAGGTSVDTGAVLAAIDKASAAESTTVAALQAQISDLTARLAAAGGALAGP